LSAWSDVIDKVRAFSVGGVDYITKPFQIEETIARIQTHLTLRALQKALNQKNETLSQTLIQLQQTQTQLIQSEKMAALGQLVANVAHEINTPLGAVRSSAEIVSHFLTQLEPLTRLLQSLTPDQQQFFFTLLQSSIEAMPELAKFPYVFNYHEVKADIKLVAESLNDPYHIDHVHRNSIKTFMGNLNRASVEFNIEMEGTALTGSYMRENTGNFFEKFYFGFDKEIKTNFAFYFPHTSKLHIAFKGKNMFIYEHFYPIEADRIMMLQITCWEGIFRRFPSWFAKKMMLDKSNTIVEEDIDFLESNKYYHDTQNVHDLLIKADKVSIEFAKLWRENVDKQKKELV
jgi:CheY-like chemotaxis protein